MTNLQKYYEEIIFGSDETSDCRCFHLRTGKAKYKDSGIMECGTSCEKCREESKKWLNEQYVDIRLNDIEKLLLRSVDSKYEWIARDKNGDLFLFDWEEPTRQFRKWDNMSVKGDFRVYNHLFLMVKASDEQATKISDLISAE